MDQNSKDTEYLSICRECGNTGLQRIVAQYNQNTVDWSDGEPDIMYENK